MNIIETYHLTKEYADFTAVTEPEHAHTPGQCLWIPGTKRSRKIHYHENVFGTDKTHKRPLYH